MMNKVPMFDSSPDPEEPRKTDSVAISPKVAFSGHRIVFGRSSISDETTIRSRQLRG
jgi:hypothetical protein